MARRGEQSRVQVALGMDLPVGLASASLSQRSVFGEANPSFVRGSGPRHGPPTTSRRIGVCPVSRGSPTKGAERSNIPSTPSAAARDSGRTLA